MSNLSSLFRNIYIPVCPIKNVMVSGPLGLIDTRNIIGSVLNLIPVGKGGLVSMVLGTVGYQIGAKAGQTAMNSFKR